MRNWYGMRNGTKRGRLTAYQVIFIIRMKTQLVDNKFVRNLKCSIFEIHSLG